VRAEAERPVVGPPGADRADAVAVRLAGVSRWYGRVRAIDEVTLEVRRGEFLSLLGPSGCGKTTTLNVIAGFVEPSAGRVVIEGEDVTDVPTYRRRLGMVFQNYALFPHLTVFENVAFGLRVRRAPRGEIAGRVGEALGLVRLAGFEDRRPRQLSGGQQQRIALARALVTRPRVLLLDEPLAALDKNLRDEMRVELKEIQRRTGLTTIFVTHDQEEALSLSDRVVVMQDGRVEQVSAPRELYDRPLTRFVATFVGASNVLGGVVERGGVDRALVLFDGLGRLEISPDRPLAAGERVEAFVRPERLALARAPSEGGEGWPGRVVHLVYLGDKTEAYLEVGGGGRLVARIPVQEELGPLAAGDTVWVRPDPRHVRVLA
jgi:spermidine/putrescine ABC transporter ATP-binding subunit